MVDEKTKKNIKVSWAITVCNEVAEFEKLLTSLFEKGIVQEGDEVVVLQDKSKGKEFVDRVREICSKFEVKYVTDTFQKDFAAWKNKLNDLCTGDYIFQIDADEELQPETGQYVHEAVKSYPNLDLIAFPRQNIIEGITSRDYQAFHWKKCPEGINWPDFQFRFYRNCPEIRWKGNVHERPVGFKAWTLAPPRYKLVHVKALEKQRKQNAFYKELTKSKPSY